MKIVQDW